MPPSLNKQKVSGVGMNLRLEVIDEFIETMPQVDFIEVIADNWFSNGPHHKKLLKIREDYELSFHCVGMNLGGVDKIDVRYLQKIADLKKRYDPFQTSDHLAFQAHGGRFHHDLLPFPFTKDYLENAIQRIQYVQEFLQEKILIENLSYYIEFRSSDMDELSFINSVLVGADCGLLLDINNLWVNYQNLGLSVENFLSGILWDKVKEIHVAGAENFDGVWVDTHGECISKVVLGTLENYNKKALTLPIVYERDSNIQSLSQWTDEHNKIQDVLNG